MTKGEQFRSGLGIGVLIAAFIVWLVWFWYSIMLSGVSVKPTPDAAPPDCTDTCNVLVNEAWVECQHFLDEAHPGWSLRACYPDGGP